MQPESGIKTWQWVVTAIVVIVLIVIGIMVFGNKGAQAPTSPEGTTSSTSGANVPGALNRIVMTDQYPGNVVYISSVNMASPGWVVVKNDKNGQPGDVIGTAAVQSGIAPVKVTLKTPTVDGGTYYAILYSTDGGSSFNPATDQPLLDGNGNIIMHLFHASASVGASLKG